MDLKYEYNQRLPRLQSMAREIEVALQELLKGTRRVDKISARAKSVDSFLGKVTRKKYADPFQDMQDQIGARVVVYYREDVERIARTILLDFPCIEAKTIKEPGPKLFWYEARHYICTIPPDIPGRSVCPVDFFELQVSTLFQHAWAEANHDLGYKPEIAIADDEQRRLAWAAAQAWGADTIFNEMWLAKNRNQEPARS